MSIRKQAFSGVRWTTLSSLGRAFLQLIQLGILARFLSPADFGLVAIAMATMVFIQIFADAGISNAIIHYQDITNEQLSSLYWLNVGVAIFLALLLSIASYWIAILYHHPELKGLLIIASITLIFGAIAQQLRITAQKNFHFSTLAKVSLSSEAIGTIVAIYLAWIGIGVYALMLGGLVASMIGCLLAWLYLSDGWRPSLRFRLSAIYKFLKFGAYMIGNNLVNAFNAQIDILLGGRILGAESLGLYSVPKELSLKVSSVINPIITHVGFPVMSKIQEDTDRLRSIYLKTMRMTSSVNFPIYIAMGLFSGEIVRLFLGKNWVEAIPLLQVFSAYAALRSMGNPVGSLLLAKGRADLSFKWNLMLLFVIPPCIWLGSFYGVMGMAFVMVGLGVVFYIPGWYFLIRPLCGAKLGEYSRQSAIPFIIALVSGVISRLLVEPLHDDISRLFFGLFCGGIIYALLSWKFNRTWLNAMVELVQAKS